MSSAAAEIQTTPTPILDCLTPLPPLIKPGSRSAHLVGQVVGFLLGLGIAFPALWVLANSERLFPGWTSTRFLSAGFAIFLVMFAAIVIHESGHLLVGLCVGFRFNGMHIGPMQIDRPFRISRYRGAGSAHWLSGAVNLLPKKTDRLSLRALLMVFAGPAANLLSAYVVFLLPYSRGFASNFFIFFSALTGVVSLIPSRGLVTHSDGGRILMLLQSRERGERWLAMLKLVAKVAEGVPFESLSPDFLAKAIAIRDNSPDTVTAHLLAYAAAWWQRKDAETAQLLETCLEYSGYVAPLVREMLISNAAVFQARRRKRADLAEQWLALLPKTTLTPGLYASAEAGILEAKGDIKGALKKLYEVEALTLTKPNEIQRKVALESLRRWRSELLEIGGSAANFKDSHGVLKSS